MESTIVSLMERCRRRQCGRAKRLLSVVSLTEKSSPVRSESDRGFASLVWWWACIVVGLMQQCLALQPAAVDGKLLVLNVQYIKLIQTTDTRLNIL